MIVQRGRGRTRGRAAWSGGGDQGYAPPMQRLCFTILPIVALVVALACSEDGSGTSGSGGGRSSTSAGAFTGAGGDPPTDAAATGAGGGPDPNVTITTSPCSTATACTLSFSGVGFDAFDGETIFWGVLPAGGTTVTFESSGAIAGGAFSFTEPMVLQNGSTYRLHYFIDANDSMTCDPPPTDMVWLIDLSTIHQNLTVDVVYSDQSVNELGCNGF